MMQSISDLDVILHCRGLILVLHNSPSQITLILLAHLDQTHVILLLRKLIIRRTISPNMLNAVVILAQVMLGTAVLSVLALSVNVNTASMIVSVQLAKAHIIMYDAACTPIIRQLFIIITHPEG